MIGGSGGGGVVEKMSWKNKAGRITMVFAIAFIALHSFMEHHLMDVAYNPFILCVFANLNLDKEKKKCMTLNKH